MLLHGPPGTGKTLLAKVSMSDNELWIDSSTSLPRDGNDGKGLVMKAI